MGRRPRVSIVVPTFNCGPYIGRTLDTVIEQSLTDWELLVMDACSTDGTPDIVAAAAHPNVTVHVEPDEGVAHAWDKGISKSRGDYVMLLCGQDGYQDLTWLQTCVDIMDDDREVSLVWGVPGTQLPETSGVFVSDPWDIYLRDSERLRERQKDGWLWYWLQAGCGFPDGNMCVRRNVLRACMPPYVMGTHVMDKLQPFFYQFNTRGYMPYGVGVVASYATAHDARLSATKARDARLSIHDYLRRLRRYRTQLLDDRVQHIYRDGDGVPIGVVPPLAGRLTRADFLIQTKDGRMIDATDLVMGYFSAG